VTTAVGRTSAIGSVTTETFGRWSVANHSFEIRTRLQPSG
jgi:hypothetical protein